MSTPERVRDAEQTWPVYATMISLNVASVEASARSVINHAVRRLQEFGSNQLICLYADLSPNDWRNLHREIRETCERTINVRIHRSLVDNRGPRASYVFVADPAS